MTLVVSQSPLSTSSEVISTPEMFRFQTYLRISLITDLKVRAVPFGLPYFLVVCIDGSSDGDVVI